MPKQIKSLEVSKAGGKPGAVAIAGPAHIDYATSPQELWDIIHARFGTWEYTLTERQQMSQKAKLQEQITKGQKEPEVPSPKPKAEDPSPLDLAIHQIIKAQINHLQPLNLTWAKMSETQRKEWTKKIWAKNKSKIRAAAQSQIQLAKKLEFTLPPIQIGEKE